MILVTNHERNRQELTTDSQGCAFTEITEQKLVPNSTELSK